VGKFGISYRPDRLTNQEGGQVFVGVTDVIGAESRSVPAGFTDIRSYLRFRFPGNFLLELVN